MKVEAVEIDPALHQRLMQANADMAAIQQMMEMFTGHCQAKIKAHQQLVQKTWGEIQARYNVDLNRVMYEPDAKEPKIIPVQVMLVDPTSRR